MQISEGKSYKFGVCVVQVKKESSLLDTKLIGLTFLAELTFFISTASREDHHRFSIFNSSLAKQVCLLVKYSKFLFPRPKSISNLDNYGQHLDQIRCILEVVRIFVQEESTFAHHIDQILSLVWHLKWQQKKGHFRIVDEDPDSLEELPEESKPHFD